MASLYREYGYLCAFTAYRSCECSIFLYCLNYSLFYHLFELVYRSSTDGTHEYFQITKSCSCKL